MSDTPWMPGPWRVAEVIANSPATRIDSNEGDPVAWVYKEGNEALIAAAPEMAELLRGIISLLHAGHFERGEDGAALPKPPLAECKKSSACPKAAALLARIRGE